MEERVAGTGDLADGQMTKVTVGGEDTASGARRRPLPRDRLALPARGRAAAGGSAQRPALCPWHKATLQQGGRATPAATDAIFAPFNENLSDYGFVVRSFWNNAKQHVVPDPSGLVK